MSFRTSGAVLAKDSQWVIKSRNEDIPGSLDGYRRDWKEFFNQYAGSVETWKGRNDGYHRALATLEKFYVPENVRVWELRNWYSRLWQPILLLAEKLNAMQATCRMFCRSPQRAV
jgi:hypothetical protein